MLRVIVFGALAALVLSLLLVIYFQETKFYVDIYANHATVIGLIITLVGFALTIWILLETRNQIQTEVTRYRSMVSRLLDDIRLHTFRDTCNQAYSCLEQARDAIRTGSGLRAVEKTADARSFVLRVLEFSELADSERTALRAIVEDLRDTISFIDQKAGATTVLKIPAKKLEPMNLLRDQLDQIRSRTFRNLTEFKDVT